MRRRLKVMTEAECYARLYGGPRRIEGVRERSRLVSTLSGEQIRRFFEDRLQSREREAA